MSSSETRKARRAEERNPKIQAYKNGYTEGSTAGFRQGYMACLDDVGRVFGKENLQLFLDRLQKDKVSTDIQTDADGNVLLTPDQAELLGVKPEEPQEEQPVPKPAPQQNLDEYYTQEAFDAAFKAAKEAGLPFRGRLIKQVED